MLTAKLARSRTDGDTITPLFIDPDDERYRETATELIEIFTEHLPEPKGYLGSHRINRFSIRYPRL